jgi:hypothetical protein
MATALFKPQTASFGELVLRPRAHRMRGFAVWSPATEDDETRRARGRLFVTVGFIAAFVTFLSSLYVVDTAVYAPGTMHAPAPAAPVDYD